MESNNKLIKYIGISNTVSQLEQDYEFRIQEESLLKTLDYLGSRYTVYKSYDHITEPTSKYDTDMLFKIRLDREEIMWVYFQFAPKSKYISIEVDNDTVADIKPQLTGFVRIRERVTPNYPTLKLIFHSYSQIERSLERICDRLDKNYKTTTSKTADINTPMKPKGIVHNPDGFIQYLCGRCGTSFKKASRCPECGQLVKA